MTDLNKFLDAQENDFALALHEIESGKKQNHWMWYIFPQLKGLGFSYMSEKYGIRDLKEASDYLQHPVLGARLKQISKALLSLDKNDPDDILGSIDAIKLRSSMTLFDIVDEDENSVFKRVLDKFYGGKVDEKTLDMLKDQE